MDIITKARELGELIASSDEMEDLKTCEERVLQDKKADRLLREQNMIRNEIAKLAVEDKNSEKIKELKKIFAAKQEEIRNYSVTADFIEAKSAFDKLMETINNVLRFTITGEEPCTHDNCSSCKGCSDHK